MGPPGQYCSGIFQRKIASKLARAISFYIDTKQITGGVDKSQRVSFRWKITRKQTGAGGGDAKKRGRGGKKKVKEE